MSINLPEYIFIPYTFIFERMLFPRHSVMQRPVRCILYPQRTGSLIMEIQTWKTNRYKQALQALSKFSKILKDYHPVNPSVIAEMSS